MSIRRSLSVLSLAVIAMLMKGQALAQTASPPSTSLTQTNDLKSLQERISQQEEQIKKLQKAMEEERSMLQQAMANMNSVAATNNSPATVNTVNASNSSNASPAILTPAVNGGPNSHWPHIAGQNLQASQKPSPLSIPIGNSTFTPLGFVDATFFGRSSNLGSGIGTNFGSVPFNNSVSAHLSENNFSTQNSRIGFRVDSKVLGAKVLGYFEADFLGNQAANVFVTSNADTFRMRNVFADIQKGKFEFLGGQDWSMMTPNRKGLSPIPGDIFYTQNMDTNYQAGLVWSRQTQFRFVYHPSENLAVGLSLENPQQYIGGSGGLTATAITLPANYASTLIPQFNNGANAVAAGSSTVTGAGNFSAPNLHPDIIVKAAYDGHVGKKDQIMHIEAATLVRSFKDTLPMGTPTQYNSSSTTAVSGSVNANLEVFKNVRLIANTFFGEGGGRYVFGLAPDVMVRSNGTISPIHTYSTVDGIEANLNKNLLLTAYYGGVYIGRQVGIDTPTASNPRPLIGYGFPGSTNGDNRSIQEFTFGLTQTLWKSPSYGALSIISQYSYLLRHPWSEPSNAPRSAHTNMYWVDLRYTLP